MDKSTPQGRLVWARERAKLARRDVADRTGLTMKLIESHENGRGLKRGLSTRYSPLYARAYGVSESWLISGAGDPIGSRGGIIRVPVRGVLQAGAWRESFEMPPDEQFEVAIAARPDLDRETLYGAVVRGNSMNKVYPDGTTVVLRRGFDGPADLIPGKRYHVERVRDDGSVENTLKKVRVTEAGKIYLIPESDDPEFFDAIPVERRPGETISFVGRAVVAIVNE